jgi:hypothetical protein
LTTVAVVIPFRSDDPERVRIKEWVDARWAAIHPAWPVVIVGDGKESGPFNRARAVNRGVGSVATDVVVVADADIAVMHGQAEACAAAIAQGHVPWVVAYEVMTHLTKPATEEFMGRGPAARQMGSTRMEVRWSSRESVCGLVAIRREDYDLLGGNDERFQGWGWEDTAFAHKADTLLGPHYRLPGECLHLYHHLREDRKVDAQAQANRKLGRRYAAAAGDPDAMTKLAREAMNLGAW